MEQNPDKLALLLSILTFLATLIGGLTAIRFKSKLGIIMGFSAGAVIGVVFFDLLPESFSLGEKHFGVSILSSAIVAGFLFYMVLDRFSILHAHQHGSDTTTRGKIGAGSLSIHSLLDGVAIGVAFQVSVPIGILIAVAVIAHDFADGVNTVSVILKDGGKNKLAYRWLIIDSVAPIAGVISTMFFKIPDTAFSLLLAIFSGFFVYIGASDLLPESSAKHPGFKVTLMTILGVALLYFATRLANI
ncbi:MAG TPA: ZIP family metal transporter [Bacteroidia bacterium]|nr:ZIP family metal transporter [Bacteroidia bacterium]